MKHNKHDEELSRLVGMSMLHVSTTGFEDKVMQKVFYSSQFKKHVRKNIRASWFFILLSAVLFPGGFWAVYNAAVSYNSSYFDAFTSNFSGVIIPACVLLFSIVILVQVDNLLRLSKQQNAW